MNPILILKKIDKSNIKRSDFDSIFFTIYSFRSGVLNVCILFVNEIELLLTFYALFIVYDEWKLKLFALDTFSCFPILE